MTHQGILLPGSQWALWHEAGPGAGTTLRRRRAAAARALPQVPATGADWRWLPPVAQPPMTELPVALERVCTHLAWMWLGPQAPGWGTLTTAQRRHALSVGSLLRICPGRQQALKAACSQPCGGALPAWAWLELGDRLNQGLPGLHAALSSWLPADLQAQQRQLAPLDPQQPPQHPPDTSRACRAWRAAWAEWPT